MSPNGIANPAPDPCTKNPQPAIGTRLKALLVCWLLATTTGNLSGCLVNNLADGDVGGLQNGDLDALRKALNDSPDVFNNAQTTWNTILTSLNYFNSAEAQAAAYTDHGCPKTVSEVLQLVGKDVAQ